MKTYLLAFFWGLFTVGFAVGAESEPLRMALIPASPELGPTADQVLAAMADDAEVEFLERAEIDAVLQEQKLSASGLTGGNLIELGRILHADLFVVLIPRTTAPVGMPPAPGQLILYDAHNGYRLLNLAWPEKPSTAIAAAAAEIRKAVAAAKQQPPQFLLSIATVRDAGVPERLKPKTMAVAAELARQLGGIPHVVVLERDYLGQVNQDRELSSKNFALSPADRLIRLEFAPGASPEVVNLTLRITDTADKELFRQEVPDCCNDAQSAGKAAAFVAGYLKLTAAASPRVFSTESDRFFNEFHFLLERHDFATARAKLNAAIAITPDDLQLHTWQLILNRQEVPAGNYPKYWEINWKNLDLAQKLCRQFPRFQGPLYTNGEYFPIWPPKRKASVANLAEQAKWLTVFRPLYEAEYRRLGPQFDLSKGINTLAAWNAYNQYCWNLTRFDLYCDWAQWRQAVLKQALEHLEVARKFAALHPELCPPAEFNPRLFGYLHVVCHQARAMRGERIPHRPMLDPMPAESDEYIRRSADHPLLQYRIEALQLVLLRQLIADHGDPVKTATATRTYCDQAAAINRCCFASISAHELGNYFGFRQFYRRIRAIFREKLNARDNGLTVAVPSPEAPSEASPEKLFQDISTQRDPNRKAEKFIAAAETLLTYRNQAFDAHAEPHIAVDVHSFFDELGRQLARSAWYDHSELCQDAVEMLNDSTEITRLAGLADLPLNPGRRTRIIICNSSISGRNVNLLLSRQVRHKKRVRQAWCVAQFEPVAGKLTLLTSWTPEQEPSRDGGSRRQPPFAVAAPWIAVAGNGTIYLFGADGRLVREIKDLPAATVMGLTFYDHRLYAFVGQEKGDQPASATMLFSCRPDGSDRQLHISTLRDQPVSNLDGSSPFSVYQLLADPPRHRLLFNGLFTLNQHRGSGLWKYDVNTGKARLLLHSEHNYDPDPVLTATADTVFCSFRQTDYYVYHLTDDTGEMVFSVSTRKTHQCRYRWHPMRGLDCQPPFFFQADRIWLGGGSTFRILQLPKVGQSPFAFTPPAEGGHGFMLIPAADGKSTLAIDEQNIYRIALKTDGDKS